MAHNASTSAGEPISGNAGDNNEVLLSVRGVSKHFSGTVALRGVDFTVHSGEVHALVGENGAGKSTLIKILAGVYPSDAGEIQFMGDPVHPDAGRLPIAFIHQDLGLAPTLSVAENIAVVSGYSTRPGMINWRQVRARASNVLDLMKADIDPDRNVEDLTVAERSIVALGRAMGLKRRIVVLDEATAALPERDVAQLFDVLRRIRSSGVGIVYVTHRLEEVFRIADRVTVFRDGRWICTRSVSEITRKELVQEMTGRELDALSSPGHDVSSDAVLRVSDLGGPGFGPVSFNVHPGEILGLVGLRGGGHDTIGRAIYGVRSRSGRVEIDGRVLSAGDVGASLEAGLGFVSSKRGDEGIAALLSVRENLFLNPILRGGRRLPYLNSRRDEKRSCAELLERFSIRPRDTERLVDTLSGGNQQKVILARWLSLPGRKVLILEEPTAGVDVGARSDIYAMLDEATSAGLAVILISSDFEEVAAVSDRALVLGGGKIVGDVRGRDLTETQLAAMAAGAA